MITKPVEYHIEQLNGLTLIKLQGRLTMENAMSELTGKVDEMIAIGRNNFIIDLSSLEFMNSSGLSVLLQCLTLSRKAGGDVVICKVPDHVEKLLVITKLNSIFTTTESLESAKAAFN